MNQVKSIRVGLIAICIATVPLSLAQAPRTRTSGSNQTTTPTTAGPRFSGSSGNSTKGAQSGANAESAISIGANVNVVAHTATSASAQPRIQGTEITRAAAGNSGLGSNLGGATQTRTSTASAANTIVSTTGKAQTGTAANTHILIDNVEPGATPALIIFAATPSAAPIPSPSPTPSVSPSPTPTP